MSKPTDIPQDVWDEAERTWRSVIHRDANNYSICTFIARAILAERERCAMKAIDPEKTYGTSRGIEYLNGYIEGRSAAAAAIRRGAQ